MVLSEGFAGITPNQLADLLAGDGIQVGATDVSGEKVVARSDGLTKFAGEFIYRSGNEYQAMGQSFASIGDAMDYIDANPRAF